MRFSLYGASLALLLPSAIRCAFIPFTNCLDDSIQTRQPLQLQWKPLYLDVKFDTSSPNNLNITSYGNVTGQQVVGTYPPPSDPQWRDPNNTFGKIADVGSGGNFSTLFATFEVATYTAWNARASQFCPHLVDGDCPLGPSFYANASNPFDLPAFSLSHDFESPYRFSTFASEIRVISGDFAAQDIACVSAMITPDLGSSITNLIIWLPATILILTGIATLAAAIWSPWGTTDIFRWSSNYGRDEDLLRLVTPGFGDCLQYIQFVTLMGSLTLQYPGFFQPAVSQTAWSLLLFNESFVTGGNGTQSLQDGIYVVNGTYGLSAMRQLIGLSDSIDIWACMAVFLAIIAVAIVVLCQLGFFTRWLFRIVSKTSEEDLRRKNIPFTLGNMVRLLLNFFILPVVALSLFQLVISHRSPASVVGVAAVLFCTVIITCGWIMWVIFSTKPRTLLFDDMPIVLLYGPLYNTYSDSAAPYALVPVVITFMRAVAFGAVQPSGTGQIIILAICEVILIVTLNGFRPFQSQTSMNAYHTFFAIVRLITVLLSATFIDSLQVNEAAKGWVGYVILLLHACVLIFGFFLNAAQTLIEVVARSLGVAGHDAQNAPVRGSILNWRMLKNRKARDRTSMSSNAAMLRADEQADGRTRSLSASSQQLLNQAGRTPSSHRISAYGNLSNDGDATTPATDLESSPHFYRPPRRRTMTIDEMTPGAKSRNQGSAGSADLLYKDSPERLPTIRDSATGRDSPAPAYLRERADSTAGSARRSTRPDYAVREVDEYYRGPALNEQRNRKLKTGPADPEGPTATAQSWLQKLFVGFQGRKKEKETGKGFEVVRSSRMPPEMQQAAIGGADEDEAMELEDKSPPMDQEPYHDSPQMHQHELQAKAGAERSFELPAQRESQKFDFGFAQPRSNPNLREVRQASATSPPRELDHPGMRAERPSISRRDPSSQDVGLGYITRDSHETERTEPLYAPRTNESTENRRSVAERPPILGPIELGSTGLDMPSRFNSRRSANMEYGDRSEAPPLPGGSSLGPPPGRQVLRMPSYEGNDYEDERADYGYDYDEREPARRSSPPLGQGFVNPRDQANYDNERPNSFFTPSHRAGDSIHRNSFGANAALNSSSAEFVGGSPPAQGRGGFGR